MYNELGFENYNVCRLDRSILTSVHCRDSDVAICVNKMFSASQLIPPITCVLNKSLLK